MFTITFDEADSTDVSLVGGKAYGLAQMTQAGLPVSPGFSVSTLAFRQYMDAGVRQQIEALLDGVDQTSIEALETAERAIAALFEEKAFAPAIQAGLDEAYGQLCQKLGCGDLSVAVRSSATAEDAEGASFAGEYETFVGIRGAAQIGLYVRRCWASAFSARSMMYAWKNGISPLKVEMAVVVQKTVQARAAGVMFTLSPLTGDRSRIVIEASYGLGLSVVGGEVTPDRFVVNKIGGDILERVVGEKHMEYLTGHLSTPVDDDRRKQFCVTDDEVRALAALGKTLERQHKRPVDVEFAVDRELPAGSNIILLQCRPETYWTTQLAAKMPPPIRNAAEAVLNSVLRRH